MKKSILASALLIAIAFAACKNKKAAEGTDESNSAQSESSTPASNSPANEPKSYTVTFSPDTAYLGKNKEAFIRLKNGKAVELQDADGKSTGTELSYEIEVTNKHKMGEGGVYLNPSQFRLQLDNGNAITHDNYNSVSAEAESTNSSVDNKFRLPAGTKPKTLNLFYDETRVSVSVEMK